MQNNVLRKGPSSWSLGVGPQSNQRSESSLQLQQQHVRLDPEDEYREENAGGEPVRRQTEMKYADSHAYSMEEDYIKTAFLVVLHRLVYQRRACSADCVRKKGNPNRSHFKSRATSVSHLIIFLSLSSPHSLLSLLSSQQYIYLYHRSFFATTLLAIYTVSTRQKEFPR